MCKCLNKDFNFASDSFSRREAWQWLLNMAESSDYIDCSIRFLASQWKWHKSKVETFLKNLKEKGLITTTIKSARTSIAILHICKKNQDNSKIASSDNHLNTGSNEHLTSQTEISIDQEARSNCRQAALTKNYDQDTIQTALLMDSIAKGSSTWSNLEQNQDKTMASDVLTPCAVSSQDSVDTKEDTYQASLQENELCTSKTYLDQWPRLQLAKEEEKEEKTTLFESVKKEEILVVGNFDNILLVGTNPNSLKPKSYQAVEVDDVLIWAEQKLNKNLDFAYELDKFKDYWQSTRKKPPKDGVAAFRNWLRRSVEFNHTKRSNHATTLSITHKSNKVVLLQ